MLNNSYIIKSDTLSLHFKY